MKTDIKNFPKGLDVKDLLYLIWVELSKISEAMAVGSDEPVVQ